MCKYYKGYPLHLQLARQSGGRFGSSHDSEDSKKLFAALSDKTKELHSYDVPEIIALPIADGSEDYLKWLRESTEIIPEE
jgi:hypothetical protein